MAQLDRRTFVKRATQAVAGLGSLTAVVTAGETSPQRPCPPSAWKKRGIVLESAEKSGRVQSFTCPAEPLGDGGWRIWHSAYGPGIPFNIGKAEGVLGEPMVRHMAVLSRGDPAEAPFAIGNLPEEWRPVQGVPLRLNDGRHRLYFWAHGPGVVRYLAAESDDGRRYRVLDPHRPCLYHPFDRAVDGKVAAAAGLTRLAGRASKRPDGEPAAPANLISNDATNVYQLADGSFEMYSVALVEVAKDDPAYIAHDNAAGWVRVIDRYASEDGLHWTDRRRILVPDEHDPSDQQFYFLSVTHTPRGRVGVLGHYRVEAQTMDLEWCLSSDGIRWERPLRTPWISRGEPGEPDCYGIYAPHALVNHDGQWHLLYTGVNSAHNGKHAHGDPTAVVMHATCDSIWA
ncbi:MAG: hypothetical protein ABIP48_12330 [Planctomycetota bacterium]